MSAAEPPGPGRRPQSVVVGICLVVAHVAVGVFTALVVLGGDKLHTLRRSGPASYSGFTTDVYARGVTTAAVIVAVLAQCVYLIFGYFLWRGQNWSRVVMWVLSGLGILGWLVSLGSPQSTYSRVQGLLLTVINAGIIGCLTTDEASAFFGPIVIEDDAPPG